MRSLKSIFATQIALFALVLIGQASAANAQSTLFYIPSTDVVPQKEVYLEFDVLAYFKKYSKGGFQLINRATGNGDQGGVMAGYEQPLSGRIKFVADWFSGKNRFGYGTPGFAITTGKTSALYIGYIIGNSGRKNNALFVYWGITL